MPESFPPESAAIPTLPSRDLAETKTFYAALGFKLLAEHDHDDGYLILALGRYELHFFPAPDLDPATTVTGCYLRVGDVDDMHARFARAGIPEHGIPRLGPVADRPWGMREFALVDPDGNLLRVGTPRP